MATGAEVGEHVRRAFGDEDSVQLKDSDIVRWINAAQRNILIEHKVLKQVATTDLVVGQFQYDMEVLPILQIQTIHHKGRPLDYRSFQNAEEYILANDPERTQTGIPSMWYSWGNTLFLWPTPSVGKPGGPVSSPGIPPSQPGAINDNDKLTIYFLSRPKDLTGINSPLSLPDEYFDRVVEYVLSQAYELDEDNQNSDFKLGQFRDGLDRMAGDTDRPQNDSYSMITVMPEDGGW